MNSYISWVDFDPEARQQAQELLALSKSPNARDELGLATLRDGISDALFPATSTIHTKLRYKPKSIAYCPDSLCSENTEQYSLHHNHHPAHSVQVIGFLYNTAVS